LRTISAFAVLFGLNRGARKVGLIIYRILSSIVQVFYIENDAEIFPTGKVAEKGFKMVFMSNKMAMINS
jgi:hypothetical protein